MKDTAWFDEMEKRIPHDGVRTRFAPSPTGYMHVGNLRTALYTYLIARHNRGKYILRIEDTDQGRLVEGATDVIYRTLSECGLEHDEGPDIGGPVGPYIQTERRSLYKEYADLLVSRGHAYRCFCEKTESEEESGIFEMKEDPCRSLSPEQAEALAEEGKPFVIRQRIPREGTTTFKDEIFGEVTVENKTLDDQVLLKRDGLPTYNFANVIDDHLMGITHVVRGTEYLSSAPKYNLLYEGFGWEIPKYVHCSPVMRDAHNKMSKRHGDPSYEDLKNQGFLTDAILNYVALLGWSPRGEEEMFSLAELEEVFDLSGMSKSPAIFDIEKLRHFNAEYIRAMTAEQFAEAAKPWIRISVQNESYDLSKIAALLQQRTEILSEIPEKVDFFDVLPEYGKELFVHKKSKSDESSSLEILQEIKPVFEALSDWNNESLLNAMVTTAEKMEYKNAKVMWPVRIAVAGKAVTPGGSSEICEILGKEETLKRIEIAINLLKS
ncbi:MAG: glutamate--tRNA ligase [Oscillospiraceae bacterium]|jgi:glutamyl-tRNA synthetase|nr:glutamate--tRNA ligase [Oscillospiraceae bacterium]